MSRLDQAARRLQSALDRLDRAVAAKAAEGGAADEDLLAALEGTRRENARLQAVAAQATTRLDAVIGRLKTVLED
jgi:division protein CdvB (Snf7/Vps24/ESCRT-III family)